MSEPVIFYSGPIVTRQEAIAQRLKHYFTGKPCVNGHIEKRSVISFCCLECSRRATRRYYLTNPEKAKNFSKNWRKNNPEKVKEQKKRNYKTEKGRLAQKARSKKFYILNKQKHNDSSKISSKKWRDKKTPAYKAWKMRYYARKKQAYGRFTKKDLEEVLMRQKYKCLNCKSCLKNGYDVDHIMPLAKGGDNTKYNIQALCRLCNAKKKDKHPIDWALENGRLV